MHCENIWFNSKAPASETVLILDSSFLINQGYLFPHLACQSQVCEGGETYGSELIEQGDFFNVRFQNLVLFLSLSLLLLNLTSGSLKS